MIVGDIESRARTRSGRGPLRGDFSRGRRPPPPPLAEPRQMGRRDFTLVDAESVARGLLGWHSVPRGHADGPALNVLSDLLTCGRRSRLWNELVERRKLATWVETGQDDSRWAGQFLLQVEAASDVEPARIEQAITELIAKIAEEGPTPEELSRSRPPPRSRLAAGSRRIWPVWRPASETWHSGTTGGPGRPSTGPPWPSRPTTFAGSPPPTWSTRVS